MREMIITKQEEIALSAIKRFFITECKIPSAKTLSKILNVKKTIAVYMLSGLVCLGILHKNRVGGLRFSRVPFSVKVI